MHLQDPDQDLHRRTTTTSPAEAAAAASVNSPLLTSLSLSSSQVVNASHAINADKKPLILLESLPDEMKLEISRHLTPQQLQILRLTSKNMNEFVKDFFVETLYGPMNLLSRYLNSRVAQYRSACRQFVKDAEPVAMIKLPFSVKENHASLLFWLICLLAMVYLNEYKTYGVYREHHFHNGTTTQSMAPSIANSISFRTQGENFPPLFITTMWYVFFLLAAYILPRLLLGIIQAQYPNPLPANNRAQLKSIVDTYADLMQRIPIDGQINTCTIAQAIAWAKRQADTSNPFVHSLLDSMAALLKNAKGTKAETLNLKGNLTLFPVVQKYNETANQTHKIAIEQLSTTPPAPSL